MSNDNEVDMVQGYAMMALQGLVQPSSNMLELAEQTIASKAFDIGEAMLEEAKKRGHFKPEED